MKRAVPLPTVLPLGGGLLGLFVAALARAANRAYSPSRVAATTRVGCELVIVPIDAELAAMVSLRKLVRQLGATARCRRGLARSAR